MDNNSKIFFSGVVTCFRNVLNSMLNVSKLKPVEKSDKEWMDAFYNAAKEPDFDKFLTEVMNGHENMNLYSLGKFTRAWRTAWLLARSFEDWIKPVEEKKEDKNDNLCS